MTFVVEAEGLTKWYGAVIALNDIKVNVVSGITALLGPNGAGKSSFINMCTGQLRATRGSLKILGEDVWGNHKLMLRVGLSHQYDNFYEDMHAIRFLSVMAELSGFRGGRIRGVVQETLHRVSLDEKAWKRPIRGYSKGMRQRVKLAQALMHEPELLFLDEPMTGLDPVGRHDIAELIMKLAEEGKSVVVSTHILHEVESLTDQILLLANGRVVAEGNVHQIRESLENHPFTIKVVCERPRRVAEIMMGHEHINGVEVEHHPRRQLTLKTHRADLVFEALPKVLMEMGGTVEEISSPDDNLESVFEYLVRGL